MARFVPHALILLIVALCAAASFGAARAFPLPGDDDYNAGGFVVRHASVRFAWRALSPLRDDPSRQEQDRRIARYLELNGRIDALEREASGAQEPGATLAEARRLRSERKALENDVERAMEQRLGEVIRDLGLTRDIGRNVVWPPVAIEFEPPPSVLVTSPRSVIERHDEALLEGDLPLDRIDQIESKAERDGETSALVVPVGGIALYPAVVPPTSDYGFLAEDIAHEWMHHYLYFTPLGRDYFRGGDLTTLNETVANIVGRELGAALVQRYPLPGNGDTAPVPAAPAPGIDFRAEMRALRLEVERLLAEQRVTDAERLMDEKRLSLAEQGYTIRRLNQAYFAFYGAYADGPASIDPIGPKLARLRETSASLSAFVRQVRELTSQDALDRALGGD